jgi:hypothetical protein
MNRRSLCSAGFFASVVIVLMTVLSGCTDPNTMQVKGAHDSISAEHESRLSR